MQNTVDNAYVARSTFRRISTARLRNQDERATPMCTLTLQREKEPQQQQQQRATFGSSRIANEREMQPVMRLRVRDAHKFTTAAQQHTRHLGLPVVVSRRMVDSKGEPRRSREFIVTAAVSSRALARVPFISAVLSRPLKR